MLLLLVLVVGAQAQYALVVVPVDSGATQAKLTTRFSQRQAALDYIRDLPALLQSRGYWAASVDSVLVDSLAATIHLYRGSYFELTHLTLPQEYAALLPTDRGRRYRTKNPLNPEAYRNQLLSYFEENGYPFARIKYDSIVWQHATVAARVVIDKGAPYKIDSIFQGGSLRMAPSFLYRYLDLTPGMPYTRSRLEAIDQRLNELIFARPSRPMDISMLGTGSVVNVYLEPRRSNVVNVLLGAMPASTQTPGNRLQVTGDVNIMLRNSFRVGETLGINWQQIQFQSPRLQLQYNQPYLLGSRAGVDFFFDLFRKDTQFVNLQWRLGMPYQFSLQQSGKIMLLQRQTNVTTVDTGFVLQNFRLPDLAATSALSVGFDYQLNTTDYRLNPRRGSEVSVLVTAGTKRLQRSTEISNLKSPAQPDFNFAALYDSVGTNTYQATLRMQAATYNQLGRASVLKLELRGGWYESGNYFRNELFQIGGFRMLRGFDEESIFARGYTVGTVEYRLLSGRNAYFFGFLDGAYAQYKDQLQQFGHSYIGTGLGLALETANSIINISWATGKRNDLPLDLRQSKIHLGVVNFF